MAWVETRKLTDGMTTYRVVWRAKGERHRSPAMDSKAEAERFMAILEGNQAQGVYYDPGRPRTPFGVYAETWSRTRPIGKNVEATRKKEESYLKVRILPYWYDRPIGQIENAEVRQWINELVEPTDEDEKPLAAATIHSIYGLFSQIMRQAELDRYLPMGNPIGKRAVPLPPKGIDRRQFLTTMELDHLLDVCRTAFPAAYPLIYVGAYTGMRNGELRALDRASYNSIGQYLYVDRGAKRARGGAHIGGTKADRARRIDLDSGLKGVLDAQLASHDHDLIFPSASGLVIDPNRWRARIWQPLCEQAGFGAPLLHFHDLRHTHISHLLASGTDVVTVAQRAGHANNSTPLNLYGHAIPGQQKEALLRYRAWAAG